MPALTLRPAPLDRVAALRALPAVAIALAGGAWLALGVAVVLGGDLASAETLWIGVAGGCACASGVVVGSTGNVTWAAVPALLAVVAVAVAAAAGEATGGATVPRFDRADVAPRDGGAKARDQAAKPVAAGGHESVAGGEAPVHGGVTVAVAAKFVRSYYAALDAGEFATAWARLSPGVQARFGGFDHWRAGYAATVGQRVEGVEAGGAEIRHVLIARDRMPCGKTVEQRFLVTWTVAHNRATALHAVKVAGEDPAAAC